MKPLAERLRPTTLDGYIGQKHLVGEGAVLRKMIESGNLASFILWGPPGVGKTTLAQIIATQSQRSFYSLSAVSSSVKDVREVIESAEKNRLFNPKPPILFIDEIHRFSKSQQDSLLAAVEKGTFVLIGATTENPSFEVISPLLSRCRVYVLKPLEKEDLLELINIALTQDEELKKKSVELAEIDSLLLYSGGDARKLLSALELVLSTEVDEKIILTNELVKSKLQANLLAYDKLGEMHYDIISAFIKSIRGSDPDAAIYWLARMIDGGEDPKFIARRLIISAAEDIGFCQYDTSFWKSYFMYRIKTGICQKKSIGIGQTYIFRSRNQQTTRNEFGVFAAFHHPGQPIHGRLRIASSYGFDESRDDVVMHFAVLVVGQRIFLQAFHHGGIIDNDWIVVFFGLAHQVDNIQHLACISTGKTIQTFAFFYAYVSLFQFFVFFDGAFYEFIQIGFFERFERINLATREQGRDDFERWVLGGGANQDKSAVFHSRQQRILLRLVEAMDFVDEQHRRLAVEKAAVAGLVNHFAHFLHTRCDGAERKKRTFHLRSHDFCQCGFSHTRRSP